MRNLALRSRVEHDQQAHSTRHRTRESAIAEAKSAVHRYGAVLHAYVCPFCEYRHIGAPTRLVRFIENSHRKRVDAVMLDMLGERAYFCGVDESEGKTEKRKRVIVNRIEKALKRAAKVTSLVRCG